MFFEHRALWLPKDVRRPEEYQDAFAIDEAGGVAAVADGVASSLFSARWARLLVEGVIAVPPNVNDAANLDEWLTALRQQWAKSIDAAALAWPQKAKVRDGAAATLLWIEVTAEPENRLTGPFQYNCRCIGDCCVFHLRGNEIARAFPFESSAAFNNQPDSLCSVRRLGDQPVFAALADKCWPGDWLVICTDALAEWILQRREAGAVPPFLEWWDMPPERFGDWLAPLREARTIRYDDTTVVLLRMRGEEMND